MTGTQVLPAPPKEAETAVEPIQVLDWTCRCDACPESVLSHAWVRVYLPYGVLDYCYHHFAMYETEMRAIAVDILDERKFLEPKLDVSP